MQRYRNFCGIRVWAGEESSVRLNWQASDHCPSAGAFGIHLIFYRCAEKELSIERVMHGARDIPRRILEPPQLES